jgi:hypothetical protein
MNFEEDTVALDIKDFKDALKQLSTTKKDEVNGIDEIVKYVDVFKSAEIVCKLTPEQRTKIAEAIDKAIQEKLKKK